MKKTKNKIAGFILALFAMLAFAPSVSKAQCPDFYNELSCPVKMQVDVYAFQGGVCGVLCQSYVTSVPANSSIILSCCSPLCNVVINILDIGGSTASGTADFSNTYPNLAPVTGGCGASTIEFGYAGSTPRFKLR